MARSTYHSNRGTCDNKMGIMCHWCNKRKATQLAPIMVDGDGVVMVEMCNKCKIKIYGHFK